MHVDHDTCLNLSIYFVFGGLCKEKKRMVIRCSMHNIASLVRGKMKLLL